MLRLLRAGVRACLRPAGCRVRPGTGGKVEENGWRVQGSSLTLTHHLQGLNALAEEAVQSLEKTQPLASAGEVVGVARGGVAIWSSDPCL